jgi:hypothetical protein
MVLGMVNDKAIDKVLALLPRQASITLRKRKFPGIETKMLAEQGQGLWD